MEPKEDKYGGKLGKTNETIKGKDRECGGSPMGVRKVRSTSVDVSLLPTNAAHVLGAQSQLIF
jgi:hypothetical protein